MRVVHRVLSVLIVTPAVLAVTSCGGSSGGTALPTSDTSPAIASSVSTSSAVASTAASSTDSPEAMFRFPSDTKFVFEGIPSDSANAPLVHDWKIALMSYAQATFEWNPNDRTMLEYNVGAHGAYLISLVKASIAHNYTVIGTYYARNLKVLSKAANSAKIQWCTSEYKFFSRNKSTNRAEVFHSKEDYALVIGEFQYVASVKHWALANTHVTYGTPC